MPRPRRGGRRWLDYDEVAEVAGCAPVSVRNACQQGRLPYRIVTWRSGHYVRRKRMIADVDVIDWLYTKAPPALRAKLAQLPPPEPPGSV
jgi:hypothetical protein